MTFEQQWIEYDYNPFVLFSSNAKVLSLNSEAQFLLGFVTTEELFNLATTYANVSFGFKTTFLELEFGRYKFFAITVGYENDEAIGIKLYQSPSFKLNKPKPIGELANIYALVDLCILTYSINSKIIFEKDFDPTIPEIIIDSNNFIKILNKAYSCYENNQKIVTKIFYRVGEHIKFEDKKYSIFSVEVYSQNINEEKVNELKVLATNTNFYIDIQKKVTINIPMIIS
ncbi:MAG: hypothetical protein A3K14_06030 [Sulfurimonas sp. RIFCSPLOWO2_12_FULL_36_74]|uniref:hypothetical protein n=1 Tax=Sulfurimonas sp. RIFCSPLOWO2_12_36_12 TaxID=1802253 RepID=UPI0008AAC3D2|nr:hypothetical protein [Sulfurimonas sp. RIFCSPLOWO2_12_36_12]OHE01878.1 MAG: hypothetical protein A2W82_08845 [Sulfurimonas sp. RIFCSPLOWO2_12_36_12]OHE05215.1 MAG: hypothetical protein A3K14_06030 [Sulfurimonas sp. RIFCSPLOWO2_12_FULL_36_74]